LQRLPLDTVAEHLVSFTFQSFDFIW